MTDVLIKKNIFGDNAFEDDDDDGFSSDDEDEEDDYLTG